MSENEINESNIFKELSWELDFWKEQENENNITQIRDIFYYLRLAIKILLVSNIWIFIFLVLSFLYIKLENNNDMLEVSYLNPICPILLWFDISSQVWDCSSVRALSYKYSADISNIEQEAAKKILDIVPLLSSIKNFTLSKDVKFLVDRTQNRLKPLAMFEEFDKLKNSFSSSDKWQIKCQNIEILSSGDFSISCSAYSSDWNTSIQTREAWKKASWTSISLAANFIDYIEKNSKNFEIEDKQKSFSQENFSWNWYYTKKTDFTLHMKYNSNNINNF